MNELCETETPSESLLALPERAPEEIAAAVMLDGVPLPADFEEFAATMIEQTKGVHYKPVTRVVAAICALATMHQSTMHKWFLSAKESFRTSRLRGWHAWVRFCGDAGVTLENMRHDESPQLLYAEFLEWSDNPENKITEHIRKDAAPAIQELFDLLRPDAKLREAAYIRTLRRNVSAVIKAAPKNATIWPFAVFAQYARDCPNPETQPWADFMGLSAAVLMSFLPCREIALIRMNPSKARVRWSDGSLIVPTQEKTDVGKGVTEMVVRREPEDRLSPRSFYDILVRRAYRLHVYNALFCSERGEVYKRSDVIGKALVRLLHRMGIFGFTGYSFRHSLIQALFDSGLDEKTVNAFTGHSNNAHTAVTFYYHLNKMWAGSKLRAAPTDRVPLRPEVVKILAMDGDDV
jgi:hypothetical protein